MKAKLDIRDREAVRSYLEREIARPAPEFSTYDPEWIRRYQRHALSFLDCAPAGATFIVAPLAGWNGKPQNFNTGENWKEIAGPAGFACKAIREARAGRGLHPLTGARA